MNGAANYGACVQAFNWPCHAWAVHFQERWFNETRTWSWKCRPCFLEEVFRGRLRRRAGASNVSNSRTFHDHDHFSKPKIFWYFDFNYHDLSACTSLCLRTCMYFTVIFFFSYSHLATWQIAEVSKYQTKANNGHIHTSACLPDRTRAFRLTSPIGKQCKEKDEKRKCVRLCRVIDGGSAGRHCRTRSQRVSANFQIVT